MDHELGKLSLDSFRGNNNGFSESPDESCHYNNYDSKHGSPIKALYHERDREKIEVSSGEDGMIKRLDGVSNQLNAHQVNCMRRYFGFRK